VSCRNSSSEDNVGSASTHSTAAANATRDTPATGDGEPNTGVKADRDDGVTARRSDARNAAVSDTDNTHHPSPHPSSNSSSATAAGTRRRHGDVSRDWYIGLYQPATTTHSAVSAVSARPTTSSSTGGYGDGRLVGNGQLNDIFNHRCSTDV